jgi:hypothetical protein
MNVVLASDVNEGIDYLFNQHVHDRRRHEYTHDANERAEGKSKEAESEPNNLGGEVDGP